MNVAPGLAERISDEKYAAAPEIRRSSKSYTLALIPAAPPALRILDVGCGTGLNSAAMAEKGHEVFGVDISDVAIEKYRAAGFAGERCNILEGLPCADASFDLVFASEVIEHLDDTQTFLAELHRVLKPDGRLVLSTPNSAFWVYRVYGLLGRTLSEVQHPGHIRFFSARGLKRSLEDANFTGVELAARHMYAVAPDGALGGALKLFGFEKEFRFKTGTYVWHLSRYARRAGGFWADTLIATATKPA